MRHIDADALKEDFDCVWFNDYDDYKRALRIIDNAPTVDIQPFAIVKFDKDELKRLVDERVIEPIKNGELVLQTDKRPQGEWIVDITTREVVCSCCRQSRRDTRTTHIFFCNHCGADMRGNNNETN